jgi:hypothetical protein
VNLYRIRAAWFGLGLAVGAALGGLVLTLVSAAGAPCVK